MLEILTLDQGVFCSIPAVRQISSGSRNHLHLSIALDYFVDYWLLPWKYLVVL